MLVYSFNLVFLSYIYVWGTQERQLLSETQECWSLPGFSAPLAFWSQDASESAGRHHRVTCGGSRGAADPAVAPQPVDPGSPRHGDRSQQQTRPWAGNTHTAGSLAADCAGLASRGRHGPGVTARPAPAASTFLPQAAPEGAGRSPGGRPRSRMPRRCGSPASSPAATQPGRRRRRRSAGSKRAPGTAPKAAASAPPRASPRLPEPPGPSGGRVLRSSSALPPPPPQRLSRGTLRATVRISPNVRPRSLPPKPLIPRRRSPARPRPNLALVPPVLRVRSFLRTYGPRPQSFAPAPVRFPRKGKADGQRLRTFPGFVTPRPAGFRIPADTHPGPAGSVALLIRAEISFLPLLPPSFLPHLGFKAHTAKGAACRRGDAAARTEGGGPVTCAARAVPPPTPGRAGTSLPWPPEHPALSAS
nr:serine/arginine repetitive matrix protein 1-like [Vulpes vulpes]